MATQLKILLLVRMLPIFKAGAAATASPRIRRPPSPNPLHWIGGFQSGRCQHLPTFIFYCILPQTSCNQCDLEFTHVITLKKHEKTEQIRRVPIWPVSAFATICLLLPTRCPRPPSGPQITQLQSQDLLLIIPLLLLLYHLTKKDLPSFEIDLLVLGKY